MDNFEFADRIIELRKQKGLSQKELGELLGVSNKAVSKWENGESMPKTSTMLKLAEILEIDGNELIGLEIKKVSENDDGLELDKLKSENALLASKLDSITKRKKRNLKIVAIVCIIGIIISGTLAFFCVGNNRVNKDIKDAGKQNTEIIFSNATYVVPDGELKLLAKEIKSRLYYYNTVNTKYAVYCSKDGKQTKALIKCDDNAPFVLLTVGKKDYIYFRKSMPKTFVRDSISDLSIYDGSIDDHHTPSAAKDIEYWMYDDDDTVAIQKFFEFYENKGKPIEKGITQRNLGKSARLVSAEIETDILGGFDYYTLNLGEFFTDENKTVCFYDYSTAEAYIVGKELARFVYPK